MRDTLLMRNEKYAWMPHWKSIFFAILVVIFPDGPIYFTIHFSTTNTLRAPYQHLLWMEQPTATSLCHTGFHSILCCDSNTKSSIWIKINWLTHSYVQRLIETVSDADAIGEKFEIVEVKASDVCRREGLKRSGCEHGPYHDVKQQ